MSTESAINSNSSIDSLEDLDNLISNLDSKEDNKKKIIKINDKNSNKTNSSIKNKEDSNSNNLELFDDYIMKEIIGDGNCFYRAICYFYRENQDEYKEFRQLIVQYIDNHPDEYISAVADEDIDILENDDELTIYNKKISFIKDYVQIAMNDGEFAGDLEITTACTLFNCNIKMYILVETGYKLYFSFHQDNIENIPTINILFVNNNHFNLLIPSENSFKDKMRLFDKDLDIKEVKKIVLDNKIKYKNKINLKFDKKMKKKIYVKYPKSGLEDYYNEIYRYLINNEIMPPRLKYDKSKNRKTQEKKRNKFRKLIKNKYKLENNRLQYLYKFNNKEKWVNIIYEEEKLSLLNYIHYSNNHMKRESMDLNLLEMGYYWFGYSKDITNFIDECGLCHSEKIKLKLPNVPKIILTKGPHKRYQADIWYLPNELKETTEYEYCLDIIDHFSKWMCSYLLKNKTSELVLAKIKSYLRANGNCEIFQTDNGKEFNNQNLKIFLENNGIKYLRSAPYHPQSNGCCEAVHKEIKKFLIAQKKKKKGKFDIDIAIEEAIDFHNNRQLKSTGYKPSELKDNTDETIIEDVIANIIKSMRRKVKLDKKSLKNSMLLICSEIKLQNNKFILKYKKSKKSFIIPAILIKYVQDDTISCKIKINFEKEDIKFKIDEIINIHINCCRLIDDFGFLYYLNLNGYNLNFEEIKKYALLED